ncbi:MAG: hypothetical protein RML32_13620 [Gammaproteobacteria bacterium]|nr:hypothetical protein [Gammaproteobacteria bacterium]
MFKGVLVTVVALSMATGCTRWLRASPCDERQPYESAESLPPLKVPPGLDAPDTRGALRIPELNEPEPPRPPGGPCLDAPPRYLPSAQSTKKS